VNRDFYNKLSEEFKKKYPSQEREEKYLYEGLLYSYPIDITVRQLNERLMSTNDIFFKQYNNENRYYLSIKDGEINPKQVNWAILSSDSYGWFPSKYEVGGMLKKYTDVENLCTELNKNKTIIITFDAKYDIQLFIDDFIDDYVYHISPRNNKEKIMKIGLAPKSSNKTANYLSRIYLTYKLSDVDKLLSDIRFHPDSKEFVIFKIKVKELLKHRIVRFFEDPAYKGFGFYTYENIPSKYIEIEKEITEV